VAAVTERGLDRGTVRAFLLALTPRDAGGVRIDDGRRTWVVPRDAPLPWAEFERAVRRGQELRAGPVSVPRDGASAVASVLWVHIPDGELAPDQVAADLASLGPAMVVRTSRGADAYWRVHPVEVDAVAEAMAVLADALHAVAGDPSGFCRVPVAPGELWAAQPPTVWTVADLVAAARLYAACKALDEASREAALASSQPAASPPTPSPGDQVPAAADEGPDAVPWPEAEALLEKVAAQEGLDPAGALWMAAVRELIRQLGAEAVCRALGVDAIGVRGGVPCVLRGDRWWQVRDGYQTPQLRPLAADEAGTGGGRP
jgi:hypothetical protein